MELARFEGHIVGYIFNQARMAFTLPANYAPSNLQSSDLVREAREYMDLWRKTASRVERGMRVPGTWRARLEASAIMVAVLNSLNMCDSEWVEHHERALRFLEQY